MTTLYEALCGQAFSTQHDANSHEWHCDQCAGVVDYLAAQERELRVQPMMLPGFG